MNFGREIRSTFWFGISILNARVIYYFARMFGALLVNFTKVSHIFSLHLFKNHIHNPFYQSADVEMSDLIEDSLEEEIHVPTDSNSRIEKVCSLTF